MNLAKSITIDIISIKNQLFRKQIIPDIIIGIILISLFFAFYYIVSFNLNNFRYESGDTAVAEQALWNTIHGDWFYQSFLKASNNFREHLNFIQFFYLPFYYLIPKTITLYAIIWLTYLVGSYILFRYVREKINTFWAFVLTLFFIFQPISIWQNVETLHLVAVASPILLVTLIYYEKRKYWPWLFLLFVFGTVSEFVFPTSIMLGLQSIYDRRSYRWIIPPFVIGFLMFIASRIYITIGFGSNQFIFKQLNYDEIIKNNIKRRLELVEEFFRPVLYIIPLFSRYVFLSIPTIATTVFIVYKNRLASGSHLFCLIPAIIVFCTVDVISRSKKNTRILIFLCILFGTLLSYPLWDDQVKIIKNDKLSELREAVNLVKDEGSVTSSRVLSYHLNHRHDFYLIGNKQFTDYIVFKTNFWDYKDEGASEFVSQVHNSDEYLKVMDKNTLVVYVKKSKISELLKKDVTKENPESIIDAYNKLQ